MKVYRLVSLAVLQQIPTHWWAISGWVPQECRRRFHEQHTPQRLEDTRVDRAVLQLDFGPSVAPAPCRNWINRSRNARAHFLNPRRASARLVTLLLIPQTSTELC